MRWVNEARKYIGLKEFKGPESNPAIVQFWKDIKRGGIKDDNTPWCAAFVGAMLEHVGIRSTRFESAKSYLEWGEPLDHPVEGCIVVFGRTGGGHVGFVVGESEAGKLVVLGGNQSDMVKLSPFGRANVLGYRWPSGEPLNTNPLPVIKVTGPEEKVT